MADVRIFHQFKTAMQSGIAKTKEWVVEFQNPEAVSIDPLMGWVSSKDTSRQLQLYFPTLQAALDFVQEKGLSYVVSNPTKTKNVPKSYETNFTCPRMRGD